MTRDRVVRWFASAAFVGFAIALSWRGAPWFVPVIFSFVGGLIVSDDVDEWMRRR